MTVANAAPTTSGATEEGDTNEDAGAFFRRLLEYRLLEQHGREYEVLHPAHQALIERTDFEACWRALGPSFPLGATLDSFRVIDEYIEPYANVGIEEQPSTAVTWEATLGYEGSFKERQTNHALLVDGHWRWVVLS